MAKLEDGINGSGKGFVNVNSKDFKVLREKIQEHYDCLSDEEKRDNILFSYRMKMERYFNSDTDEIKEVGFFVKELIKSLNIKNKDFAKYINYEESNISAFLNGKRKVNPDLALKIAKIFKLDPILIMNIQSKNELKFFAKINEKKYVKYNIGDLLAKVG